MQEIWTNISVKFENKYFSSKDHEDPENLCAKRAGNFPALVLYTDMCYPIIGKVIMCKIEGSKMDEAVLAPLGSFYLLNLDYPRNLEDGIEHPAIFYNWWQKYTRGHCTAISVDPVLLSAV